MPKKNQKQKAKKPKVKRQGQKNPGVEYHGWKPGHLIVRHSEDRERNTHKNGNASRPGKSALQIGNYSAVAAALALPHERPPIRYSSTFTTAPTTVAAPYALRTMDFSTGSPSVGPSVANGGAFVCLFRHPLRAAIVHDPNPNTLTAQYDLQFCVAGSITKTCVLTEDIVPEFQDLNPIWASDHDPSDTAKAHPHGNVLYCGTFDSRKGIWCDSNATEKCHLDITVSVAAYFTYWIFDEGEWDRVACLDCAIGLNTVDLLKSGYYTFAVRAKVAAPVMTITVSMRSASDFLCHLAMPNIPEKSALIGEMRTNSAAVLFTCEASELNKSGKIVGYQVPASNAWQSYLDFNNVSDQRGSCTKPLATGLYGFLKPSRMEDFDLVRPFTVVDGTVVGADYQIVPQHDYIVVSANTANTAGLSYPGGDCYLTLAWGVEFISSDVWFNAIPPPLSGPQFQAQLEQLKRCEQWHENPLHFSDITKFLREKGTSVGTAALKYGPSLMQLIKFLATL